MTVGSLFAGIGGFDLGFERAGFEIKWQVEIDDYASRVLAKHWPGVTRYGDIRAIDWSTVEPVDVVCGGFPCQPHSSAGKRLAAEDDRDLWPEFRRCIRALNPRWVVAENVTGILSSDDGRFFGDILRDLAESGYGVEWDCLPAAAFSAPHRRDRVWIVAHANGWGQQEREEFNCEAQQNPTDRHPRGQHAHGLRDDVADANGSRPQGRDSKELRERASQWTLGARGAFDNERFSWLPEPNVGRVAHGVPARVDRLRGLGNAVVPQITEWIAHRIKEADGNQVTEAVASGVNRGSEAK